MELELELTGVQHRTVLRSGRPCWCGLPPDNHKVGFELQEQIWVMMENCGISCIESTVQFGDNSSKKSL